MKKSILFSIIMLALTGCPAPEQSTLVLGTELITYPQAQSHCEAIGGSLALLDTEESWQDALDIWVNEATVHSEGLWTGNTINANDTTYGYAMLRGGALVPVLLDDVEHVGLPLCVIH